MHKKISIGSKTSVNDGSVISVIDSTDSIINQIEVPKTSKKALKKQKSIDLKNFNVSFLVFFYSFESKICRIISISFLDCWCNQHLCTQRRSCWTDLWTVKDLLHFIAGWLKRRKADWLDGRKKWSFLNERLSDEYFILFLSRHCLAMAYATVLSMMRHYNFFCLTCIRKFCFYRISGLSIGAALNQSLTEGLIVALAVFLYGIPQELGT